MVRTQYKREQDGQDRVRKRAGWSGQMIKESRMVRKDDKREQDAQDRV